MKALLLFVSLLCGLSLYAQQSNTFYIDGMVIASRTSAQHDLSKWKFVHPDNEWHVLVNQVFTPNWSTVRYRFAPDTVILNNMYYLQLQESWKDPSESSWSDTQIYYREESNKIFQYNNEKEELLYDFNLEEGGDFLQDFFPMEEVVLTVREKADILTLDGEERERLLLYCREDSSGMYYGFREWVTGIGDISANPFSPSGACFTDYGELLLCFHHKGELVYQHPDYQICFTSSMTEKVLPPSISLYPNPTSGIIYFQSVASISQLRLIDTTGRELMFVSEPSNEINISRLPQGMYFLVLTDKLGRSEIRKLQVLY